MNKETTIYYNGDTYIVKSQYDYDLYELRLNKDKEIERLNNEIKTLLKENGNKEKVIIKQNNIIDEFEKWLLGEKMMFYRGNDDERLIRYYEIKNKWLELKEGK